jgi:hypothetical protein
MVVANSKADELSVNATCGVGVNTVKSTPKWGNPRSVLESSDFKGTILKVGSDYKYTIAPTACHATWRNVDGTEQGDRICQFCPTDPKTYTLKILSDDEILLIYKPTGEEIGRFKRE